MKLNNERLELADEIDYEMVKSTLTFHLVQQYAAKEKTCTYQEVSVFLKKHFNITIEPFSTTLASLLGDISLSEHIKGEPMLSVVIVNKDTKRAGDGFFKLAKELGRFNGSLKSDVDKDIFFISELKKVFSLWNEEFETLQ
jgi:hypothetical protein